MNTLRSLVCLTILSILAHGCVGRQVVDFDRFAVSRALPENVSMETKVRPSLDKEDTVEYELMRIGAFVDQEEVLRDWTGKEIRFQWQMRPSGVYALEQKPTAEDLRKRAEWKEFTKKYRVILITWNQSLEADPP